MKLSAAASLVAATLFSTTFALPSQHLAHRRLHQGPRAIHARNEFESMVGRLNSTGQLQPNQAITPTGTDDTHASPDMSITGNEYVILFDPDHPEPPEVAEVMKRVGLNSSHPDVKYVFNNPAFKGFVGTMPGDSANALNNMAAVKFVEQPAKVSFASLTSANKAPWGLQRISSQSHVDGDAASLTFTYKYDNTGNLGKGVDIYVIDTGINTDHTAFGGRATNGWAYNKDLSAASDSMGHGTHVSGTAAGDGFGIARGANLIGVKVLDSDGSGTTSDIIAGLDFILHSHESKKGKPGFVGSIASMSWAVQTKSSAVEQAISGLVSQSIHASLAAGNDAGDACAATPSDLGGSQGGAVVVGAVNINDQISTFSNTGKCVDVFAPGESVISTWIGSSDATKLEEGTSMACPHVTGIMAYLMGKDHSLRQDPAKMKALIGGQALASALLNSPTTIGGGLSKLANNGVLGSSGSGSSSSSSASPTPTKPAGTTLTPVTPTPPPASTPDGGDTVVTVVETVIVPAPTSRP